MVCFISLRLFQNLIPLFLAIFLVSKHLISHENLGRIVNDPNRLGLNPVPTRK